MASGPPRLRRFLAKFAVELVPAGLLCVAAAALFAQQWFATPPAAPVAADRVAVQNERIAQMISDEHDLMVEFLKSEQVREAARQPLTIREARAIAEAERLAEEAVRRAAEAQKPVPRPRPVEPPVTVAAQPAPALPPPQAVAAVEPPVPPPAAAPRPRGTFEAIIETTGAWADKAIEVSRVREAAAAVREIPSWIGSIPDKLIGPFTSVDRPTRFAQR